jgi:CHAT domain-containing protein/tetratricopeptide (TPR) repeat protein
LGVCSRRFVIGFAASAAAFLAIAPAGAQEVAGDNQKILADIAGLIEALPPQGPERVEAIKKALDKVAAFEPWPATLSRAELRGILLRMLGEAYFGLEDGNPAANLKAAIAAFEEALLSFGELRTSDWAATQGYLAQCRLLAPSSAEDVEAAIAALRQALTFYDRAKFPEDWAWAQNLLGAAYTERELGSRKRNLEDAKEALEAALSVRTRDTHLVEYAETKINLGNVLRERVAGLRGDNIEDAIEAYDEIIDIARKNRFDAELRYAQLNLGIALVARVHGIREDNLELAIVELESVLQQVSREATPRIWALAQDSLGKAYLERARGERSENLELAVAAFGAALSALELKIYRRDWAGIQNDLGLAYSLREEGSRKENQEKALSCFEAALAISTRKAHPLDWARIQANLGSVYRVRLDGDRSQNQEKSIAATLKALQIYTHGRSPSEWAQAKLSLARALIERREGERSDNLTRAAAACRLALSVEAIDILPRGHVEAAALLGHIHLLRREWSEATRHLASARDAFLVQFGQGFEGSDARELIRSTGTLFADAAYAAVERGDAREALTIVNDGHARILRVALRRRLPGLRREESEKIAELSVKMEELRRAVAAMQDADAAATLAKVRTLRGELSVLISGALAREAPTDIADAAQQLLDDGGAIVTPVVTAIGTKFLITTLKGATVDITVIDLPELTEQRLAEFVGAGNGSGAERGWLTSYRANRTIHDLLESMATDIYLARIVPRLNVELGQKEARLKGLWREWYGAIEGLGPTLWSHFAGVLQEALARLGLSEGSKLIWLPTNALGIVPLGLAQDPTTGKRFADLHEIVYAPSLGALLLAKHNLAQPKRDRNDREPHTPLTLTVVGFEGSARVALPYAKMEEAVVEAHFHQPAVTRIDDGDAKTILSRLPLTSYWHFACHGQFKPHDPRRSRLFLTKGKLTVDDLITASEDGRLPGPRLVFLSACETGLYDVAYEPNEFTGFPSAFMSLGASGVIATLWPVRDDATLLLVAKFYDLHIRDGLSPPSSLRQAQLWLRDATLEELEAYAARQFPACVLDECATASVSKALRASDDGSPLKERPLSHPYFWSGFVYVGS